ncbi:fluoride efflux transporter CrcB [Adlercreutzia sp. R21]|uniref:fluoride efflux transporter CrcB n=1 Tax=Adlercreutzia wanghongyangiae TaxID=3111451 RepID=UPI002DB70542|nr:fluoride efflux transporter CrcB [Adlercreutzia sp. R21]MEC4184021.1 fluoride efflux transporter CrcB [Adlercreutzia sp. R21]
MMSVLCVGAGGFLGAVARYGLGLVPLWSGLPLTTLLINFAGSLVIGAVVEAAAPARAALSPEAVLFLKVGLCGGFTTFSTFSLETLELLEGGQYLAAGAYAVVSVVLCVAGVLAGKFLVRALMPAA